MIKEVTEPGILNDWRAVQCEKAESSMIKEVTELGILNDLRDAQYEKA